MKNKTNRLTICHEDDMKAVLDLIRERSSDKDVVGKLCYALLKEKLYYFLDEIDCDLGCIDRDVKHLLIRAKSGIYSRQFHQTISINKLKGGK